MDKKDVWLFGLGWDEVVVVREGASSGQLMLRVRIHVEQY